ncbi:hypothetical protein BDR04DRAFT_1111467 [Suillus decipiens]|nr:hypothetical protein BDR04DRAFT_1111467 [Suillus decipiens]
MYTLDIAEGITNHPTHLSSVLGTVLLPSRHPRSHHLPRSSPIPAHHTPHAILLIPVTQYLTCRALQGPPGWKAFLNLLFHTASEGRISSHMCDSW